MIAFYRLAEQAASWAGKTGAVCALLAGLFTCLDIAIRSFGGQGILGTVDIVTPRLPLRARALCRAFSALLGGVLMLAIGWFGIGQAQTVAMMGDKSQTIGLPMIWFWYPLLVGAFFTTALILLIVLRHLVVAVTGREVVMPVEQKAEVL